MVGELLGHAHLAGGGAIGDGQADVGVGRVQDVGAMAGAVHQSGVGLADDRLPIIGRANGCHGMEVFADGVGPTGAAVAVLRPKPLQVPVAEVAPFGHLDHVAAAGFGGHRVPHHRLQARLAARLVDQLHRQRVERVFKRKGLDVGGRGQVGRGFRRRGGLRRWRGGCGRCRGGPGHGRRDRRAGGRGRAGGYCRRLIPPVAGHEEE